MHTTRNTNTYFMNIVQIVAISMTCQVLDLKDNKIAMHPTEVTCTAHVGDVVGTAPLILIIVAACRIL